ETDVDEKYYLSDDKTAKLVAQLESKHEIITGMVRGGTQKNAYEGDGKLSPTITEAMGQGGGHVPLIVEPQMLGHVDIHGNDSIKRTYSTEGMSPTIPTGTGGGHEPMIAEERTPVQYNRKSGIGKELEQANTLSASDWHRIRKLTAKECFRLQGFPDSAHQALVDEGISDSQRYKMAGNAVTVNVIEAIGERLVKLLP